MTTPKTVWKTTIEIATENDPSDMDLEYLAREATSGSSICYKMESTEVPFKEVAGNVGEFFDGFDDDDDEMVFPDGRRRQPGK